MNRSQIRPEPPRHPGGTAAAARPARSPGGRRPFPILSLALVACLVACQPSRPDPAEEPETTGTAEAATAGASDAHVVEVTSTDYAFTAPPSVPSGWTTWRMTNEGEQTHFLLLWRLPEDRNFGDFASDISQPFNELYAEYRAGDLEQEEFFEELGAALPDWFGSLERRGGPGFTAPGRISQTTVQLEPGEYVMECYVRAPDEEGVKFHNALGMLRPLVVTEEGSGASPPEADLEITLLNYELAVEGEPGRGEQTVRVHVTEEPEGGLLGHNVQLVRLDGDTTVEEVAAWMDWVDALQPPAPAEFIGGAEQMQAGLTSYFTVDLEPGRYAWISEGYAADGMVREFIIE